jgi:hypothetical protein
MYKQIFFYLINYSLDPKVFKIKFVEIYKLCIVSNINVLSITNHF